MEITLHKCIGMYVHVLTRLNDKTEGAALHTYQSGIRVTIIFQLDIKLYNFEALALTA